MECVHLNCWFDIFTGYVGLVGRSSRLFVAFVKLTVLGIDFFAGVIVNRAFYEPYGMPFYMVYSRELIQVVLKACMLCERERETCLYGLCQPAIGVQ